MSVPTGPANSKTRPGRSINANLSTISHYLLVDQIRRLPMNASFRTLVISIQSRERSSTVRAFFISTCLGQQYSRTSLMQSTLKLQTTGSIKQSSLPCRSRASDHATLPLIGILVDFSSGNSVLCLSTFASRVPGLLDALELSVKAAGQQLQLGIGPIEFKNHRVTHVLVSARS
jgi:hypothetical protein